MKTIDAARGRWVGILANFGIDERFLRNKHGACPICDGKDRFRFDDKGGNGTYYCNGCGAGNGMDLLMAFTGWDFPKAALEVDRIVSNVTPTIPQGCDSKRALKRIQWVLGTLGDMGSINPVRLYLRGRGLPASKALMYHPAVRYYDDGKSLGEYPAMVAKFSLPTGEGATLHLTHLTEKGEKADVPSVKKFLPVAREMKGGSIRLTEIYSHIGLAEGIETALAVMRDYQMPCWATGTAGMLESFVPPEGVKEVSIFADNDVNYAGQKSAYVLAHRLSMSGYRATVTVPQEINTDFADERKTQ